jgi:Na+/proline symporter
MDIIYDTIGFMRVFVAKSILYLVIVELICKMLPKAKRIVVVVIVGAVVALASFFTIEMPNFIDTLVSILSISGIAAAFVIPLILLLVTKVKKNAEKNR